MDYIVSKEEMRIIEKNYLEENKISNKELIYKAAMAIDNNFSFKGKILMICGIGNNAADAYALSSILINNGIIPTIYLCENKFSDDGKYYFDLIKDKVYLINALDDIKDYDIIVDAIYGIGFHGDVNENIKNIIDKINQSNRFILSIDINSGLEANTGLTKKAVISNMTISLGFYKYGHFLNMAKDYIKSLINANLDFKTSSNVELFDIIRAKSCFKKRKNFTNKGDYGYAGIMGGSKNYPGAIKLASLGQNALYSGCGISRIIVPDIIADKLYPHVLESTIYPLKSNGNNFIFDELDLTKAINHLSSLVIGVGISLDSEITKILTYLLFNYEKTLIIDADAITLLSKMDLNILKKAKCKIVLTPHLKEFSRLIDKDILDIENNLVNYAMDFAKKYNVTLLLKGPTTIICNSDFMYFVSKGTPGQATAGSGDVLSGILSGLLSYNDDVITITALGAFINGLAGEIAEKKYTDISMVSSDTAREVTNAISYILNYK